LSTGRRGEKRDSCIASAGCTPKGGKKSVPLLGMRKGPSVSPQSRGKGRGRGKREKRKPTTSERKKKSFASTSLEKE